MKQRWSRLAPGPQLAFGLVLLGLTLALVYGDWLWRADKALYDANHRLLTRAAGDEIVIVAIDEQSLATLGRWPWPRRLHAELIDQLAAAGASTIIFDVIFAEPEASNPAHDLALAAAMQRHGRVILPLLVEQRQLGGQLLETLPLPALSQAAAGIGHAHMELDADGIARSVYLQEGLGTPRWPHLTVAALQAMEPGRWQQLPGRPATTPTSPTPRCWGGVTCPRASVARRCWWGPPPPVWAMCCRHRSPASTSRCRGWRSTPTSSTPCATSWRSRPLHHGNA